MLVQRAGTKEPLAAFWIRKRFHILDPETRRMDPVDEEVASNLQQSGYLFYPSLPNEIAPGSLRRFAWKNSRKEARALLLTSIVVMLVNLVVPVATGVIVATAIPAGRLDLLTEMALIVGAAAIGATGIATARSFVSLRAATMIDFRLQAAIWDRVLRLPPRFFLDYSTGDLARRLLAVGEMGQMLKGPVLSGLLSGLFASLSFVLMFYYDWRLALYGFAFAISCAIMLTIFSLTTS